MILFTLILLLPLLNFMFIGLFGRFLGYRGAMRLTLINMLISLLSTAYFVYSLYVHNFTFYVNFGTWFSVADLAIDYSFTLDRLSICMIAVILLVSYVVHLYSCIYMKMDPHFSRFLSYLSLFTFFMLLLVCADNFVVMFIGWEGVGLCSYLLIGFWHTRTAANKASIQALVVNRVGDVCLLIGMALTFYVFRSLDFDVISSTFPYVVGKDFPIFGGLKINSVLCILYLIGIMGKSAQIGLHLWLPSAMEGPTPVSALIHAATMVTAGIYLCIRLSYVFEFSSLALNLMMFIGTFSSFFTGLIGFMQSDVKKIIAYSTCTQLGFMLLMCGLSQYEMAFYHLLNHAFFKALLFLSGGVLIHVYRNQDVRKMGGLKTISSFLYAVLFIATLASDGFFFFSSVQSKDIIIEVANYALIIEANFTSIFGIISLCITVCYNSAILDVCSGNVYRKLKVSQIDVRYIITLTILVTLTLLSNYLLFQNFMTEFYADSTFTHFINSKRLNAETIPYYTKILIIILFGILSTEFTMTKSEPTREITVGCYRLIVNFSIILAIILTFGHTITVLLDMSCKDLFAEILMQYLFYGCPFILAVVFVFYVTNELHNAFDFHNVTKFLDYLIKGVYYDWILSINFSEKFVQLGFFLYKFVDKGLLSVLGPDGLSATA